MFSILDRTSEPSPVTITESTLQSLNLSFLGEASGISYMERYLTADTETIRYRQMLFSDIAEHPELISFFDELHEKIENILFCEKMGREANVANENGDILSSFRELMFFTECIDLITQTGKTLPDALRSEGLKRCLTRQNRSPDRIGMKTPSTIQMKSGLRYATSRASPSASTLTRSSARWKPALCR